MALKVSGLLTRQAGLVVALTVLVTAALAVPFVLAQPTTSSSQEPEGEVFEARDLAADRFASEVYRPVYIIAAREGNLLAREPLLALYENEARLRADPEVGAKLLNTFDPSAGRSVKGMVTIADAVDAALRASGRGGLAEASDAEVDAALSALLSMRPPRAFALSVETTRDRETGRWRSPALMAYLAADNDALGGGGQAAILGTDDLTKEVFARDAQRLLQGEQGQLEVWGLAIDANLTSAEQGRLAGPFIGFTLASVLLLMGLAFRSYWALAVNGFGLGALIIWLKGLSNLAGLKNDQILDIIVPIAMISFGVDFAFHAIGRYREELAEGVGGPKEGYRLGIAAVLGALLVAMASDASAFLANVTTGIESLVQFGVAATMATVSAFVVLGLVAPLMLAQLEHGLGLRPTTKIGTVVAVFGGLGACAVATSAVLVSVFFDALIGVVLFFGYSLVFLLIPALIANGRRRRAAAPGVEVPHLEVSAGRAVRLLGRAVAGTARARAVVLPVVAALSAVAAWGASNVRGSFDVRDFFAGTTGFVIALDAFDRHVGEQGGEPTVVYVEADVTDPATLVELRRFVERLRGLGSERLARDDRGRVLVRSGVLEVVERVMAEADVRDAMAGAAGVDLVDADGDGIPDDPEALRAVFAVARRQGVPGGAASPPMSADDVHSALWLPPSGDDGALPATQLRLRVPGSRVQENIEAARGALEPVVDELEAALRRDDERARAVLTGQPIARQAALEAILWAFRLSIPVAVFLCLIVASLFMRSVRYGVVSAAPVVLVTAWLYGFMYAIGANVNVVTATIGAISVGIGIDFSVHFTMRFREELTRQSRRIEALRAAGVGTGGALAASALSSVVGFAILAFAPMPMFASYGFLTALMIFFALVAALFVLPSLLMVVTPRARD